MNAQQFEKLDPIELKLVGLSNEIARTRKSAILLGLKSEKEIDKLLETALNDSVKAFDKLSLSDLATLNFVREFK